MSVDRQEALDMLDAVRRRIVAGEVTGILLVSQRVTEDKCDALKWGRLTPHTLIVAEKIVQLSKDQYWTPGPAEQARPLGIVRSEEEEPPP